MTFVTTGKVAMEPTQLTPQEFEQFQRLIFKLSGICIPENKVMLLSNRIRRRVKATGAAGFQSYLTLLKSPSHREELEEFFGVVTTNETSFFRTEKHFEWLQSGFLDDLRERVQRKQHDRRIRIWSAACSSGEEPYTIAMCLAENRRKISDWTIEIHGTDISQKALEKARSGVFGSQIAEQIPETLLSQYFKHDQSKNTWIVKPVLSEMVTISQHNLMESFSQHEFDCIFIRNVLIYFSRESKQIVIDNLVRSMATGGYLIIGPSEGIFDMLGMLEKRSPFLYQKVS